MGPLRSCTVRVSDEDAGPIGGGERMQQAVTRGVVTRWCLLSALFFLLACGESSCASCAGCGIEPIPGGYPAAERIANAAQVRLTAAGLEHIEQHAPSLVSTLLASNLDFAVPSSSGVFDVPIVGDVDYTLCPDGGCIAHTEIESAELASAPPHGIDVLARAVVETRDSAAARAAIPVALRGGCIFGFCTIDTTCQVDVDTSRGSRRHVALRSSLQITEEKHAAREGYSRIDVSGTAVVPEEGIEDEDVDFSGCSGLVGGLINLASGLVKGTILGTLESQVTGIVERSVAEKTCMTSGTHGCPTGTFDVEDGATGIHYCRFEAAPEADCVPALLGMEGRGDFGAALLGSIAPGAHAPAEFLFASGGDAEAVNGGLSLFLMGGLTSMDADFTHYPAHHTCVPIVEPPALPTIPRAEVFRDNTVPGLTSMPHVGIGITEPFLDHVGYGAFDSGMLCLAVGTRLSQQLSTGLVSVLARSIQNIAFPSESAPMSIALRPQRPPTFEIDEGGLIHAKLQSLEMDFYVFSMERYVRVLTFRTDATIDLSVAVVAGAIDLQILAAHAENPEVTRSELLTESPAMLAPVLATVVESFVTMINDKIPSIPLPNVMGFSLEVPEGGVLAIDDRAGVELLGIFGNLVLPDTHSIVRAADTDVEMIDAQFDARSVQLETFGQHGVPTIEVLARATARDGARIEYSHRVDGGAWSAWSAHARRTISERSLLLQGRHVVEVRARLDGDDRTIDPVPARIEVPIDALAPSVHLARTTSGVAIDASDLVSVALAYRAHVDGEWSPWAPLEAGRAAVDADVDEPVDVEVRDESGNVGAARAALIRGLPDANATSACGCEVPGRRSNLGALALLGLGAVFAFARRRRVLALLASLGLLGCSANPRAPSDPGPMPVSCESTCSEAAPPAMVGTACCEATGQCVPYEVASLCAPGYECPSGSLLVSDACAVSCAACAPKAALPEGQLATHLDLVLDDRGRALLSGYAPGVPPLLRYGDLVVGTENASGSIEWEIVDGAPRAPVTNDPDGFRGGVSDPGPDVGEWSSIARRGNTLFVSYYDRTNRALKLASREGTSPWTIRTIDDSLDAGRYTAIAVDDGGRIAIAYLRIERERPAAPSKLRSAMVVAYASDDDASDFDFDEVATAEMPCRPSLCEAGESCLASGECAPATTDCAEPCATGTVCRASECVAALASPFVEDMPPAIGLYPSLAPTEEGLALVFYDRGHGTLFGAEHDGTRWAPAFPIDGYGAERGTGDAGLSASLFVDGDGTWHIAYVDGADEALRYARVSDGGVDITRIDDGSTDGAARHPDGRHLVGDDASIVVTSAGVVRIVYQDATAHRAMLATIDGDERTVSALDRQDHTGFFLEQALVGERSRVVTFYRNEQGERRSGVRLLSIEE